MTQETRDAILHNCDCLWEKIENMNHYISSDDKEDLQFFIGCIENLVFLNELKNVMADSK